MRAITLDQPWAWAFCHGKLVENRDWAPAPALHHGEPVAIHAGVTDRSLKELWCPADEGGLGWAVWPPGREQPSIPGDPGAWPKCMERGRVLLDAEAHVQDGGDPAAVRGAVVAVATFDRVVTGKLPPTSGQADFRTSDRFGWLFSRCDPLSIPVPWPGKQKLWRLPEHVHQRVEDLWSRGLM